MSTMFDTEKCFLVYWEEEDSVSVAKSSEIKDPPPEKAMVGDIVTIKCRGKLCKLCALKAWAKTREDS